MSDIENWLADQKSNNWRMPATQRWKRIWGIRHIRAAYHARQVARHNAFWISVGKIPIGYDHWVIYGIRMGKERDFTKEPTQ